MYRNLKGSPLDFPFQLRRTLESTSSLSFCDYISINLLLMQHNSYKIVQHHVYLKRLQFLCLRSGFLSHFLSPCLSFLASVGIRAAQQGVGIANDGDQGEGEAVKGS